MREGWTYKKLGEVATFKRGLTYSGKDEVSFSDNVVLRSNNIDLATNTLNLDELKYVSSNISIPEDKKLKANSIFMCMSNGSKQHLGKVAFIDQDMPYAFGGFMGLIIPLKEKIYPKYLYFYFCSPQFKDVLSSIGNGANINNIKFVDIAKYSVKTPSLSEQQSIVAELDKINELISLKKAQLSDLDALAQSIFNDMFGDPIENEKGWEVKKLGEVSVFPSKRVNIADLTPSQYIGVENLRKDKKGVEFSQTLPNADKAIEFITDDILIGNIRPYLRKIWISNINGGASGDVIIVRKNTPSIMPMYLFKVLSTETFFEYDNANTHGAKMPRGDKKMIELFPIPLTPLSLQQDFAKRIELIEQQKAQISSAIKDLETLLASRMQYWFD